MKRWQDFRSYFWEEAPFFRLLLPLIIAIVCYDLRAPTIGKDGVLAILAFSGLLLLSAGLIRQRSRIASISRFLFVQAALFLAGLCICWVYDIRNDAHWFGKSTEDAEAYSVRVAEAPIERDRTWKVKVSVQNSISGEVVIKAAGDAYIFLYKNGKRPDVDVGDVLLLPNKWIRIKNPGNPFEFDYARFCARNNLFYHQFLGESDISVLERNATNSSMARTVHDWGMEVIDRYITDSAAAGLMQAMLLGDEVNFDDELREAYSETGIVHIVAISGSHVAIFFLVAAGLFFWVNKRHQYLKYLFAIPLIWFYVVVAGMPSSAVRAAVMFTIGGLGFILQRQQNPLNILFATAFMMLVANPMWLFAVGFQLSFVAVLSLIVFYRPVYRVVHVPNLILRRIWQTAAASIAAEILVAPIIIYYFHLLPATFLIANVIAYLFMAVGLVAGMLLTLLGKITFIAKGLGFLLGAMVGVLNKVVLALQGLNPPSFEHLHLSLAQLTLLYVSVACFAMFLLNKSNKGLLTGLGVTTLLLMALTVDKARTEKQLQLVVYNINGENYAEVIAGSKFIPVLEDSVNSLKRREYATREMHIASGAWQKREGGSEEVLSIGNKNILMLSEPISQLSDRLPAFDYVMINSPLKEFEGSRIKDVFGHSKLIIGSNQKRYITEKWKDSCLKHDISAHFTQLDGAFVLKQ